MNAPTLADYYRWLALPPDELLEQCTRTPYQASGPGGQKRNRVYSAIRLEHASTGLRAESGAYREAARNRKDALRKLRIAMAIAGSRLVPLSQSHSDSDAQAEPSTLHEIAPPPGYPAIRAKISVEHVDYPGAALLTLATFRAGQGALKETAARLALSTSAFVRFLNLDKQILNEANQIRAEAGYGSLN